MPASLHLDEDSQAGVRHQAIFVRHEGDLLGLEAVVVVARGRIQADCDAAVGVGARPCQIGPPPVDTPHCPIDNLIDTATLLGGIIWHVLALGELVAGGVNGGLGADLAI